MDSPKLPPVPSALYWENSPLNWSIEDNKTLTIMADKVTDLFTDPQGALTINNSPRLLFQPPAGSFILSAKVNVEFASKYDAGVLILYANEKCWAKLCFEFSPQHQPTVVSVVNRETSDDCNSIAVNGNEVYLRIARLDSAYAFHSSSDGRFWNLVRYFSLGEVGDIAAGFSAQSPTGESCKAIFTDIHFESGKLVDIRSGE